MRDALDARECDDARDDGRNRALDDATNRAWTPVSTMARAASARARASSGRPKRRLGPSVSIVGDGADEVVVSRDVPSSVVRGVDVGRIGGDANKGSTRDEGEESAGRAGGDASGTLAHEAERSATSTRGEEDGGVWDEEEVDTVPLARKVSARTTRTPATTTRFDEKLALAEATKRALGDVMASIRASGLDPARVFASLAGATPAGERGGFEALARGIDALSPASGGRGKRLSFSSASLRATTPRVLPDVEESETASFGSVAESFDVTVGEESEVEQEGTFPACDCGAENCTLVKMHAQRGPFALPKRVQALSVAERELNESVLSTDDESIAGTEVGELDELKEAMGALDLEDDDEAVQELFQEEEEQQEEDFSFAGESEVVVAEPLKLGTHIRFVDSPAASTPSSAPRPRSRASRRKAILSSDVEDEESDEEENANEDVSQDAEPVATAADDDDEPVMRTRPRRAAAQKVVFKRNVFVDDDLSGTDDDFEDGNDEPNSSDEDFIDDGEYDEDDYAVEYDSDAENVTPAPRKPFTKPDLSRELNEKLLIDEYSPSNLHTPTPPKEISPNTASKAFRPPPSHSKALQSALKSVTKKGAEKFNFNRHKGAITAALFEEFNTSVFEEALPTDFEITWNNKLLTTAGLTHYKRSAKTGQVVYSARIELSTKVLDTVEKLESTLLHEMCHASAWLIDKTAKPPHGPIFKKWAARAMKTYPETNVSTCHAYAIHQPYKWRCTREWCRQEYGRHSKSIDITQKACGACGGKLEYLGKFKRNGDAVQSRAPTAFSLFVKQNFKATKDALGAATPHKDVMKHLSDRWKTQMRVDSKDEPIEINDE